MRFYRPTIKQPISTFVEAPLDFMQDQMVAEQKTIDDGRTSALKMNEDFLGIRPGMKSTDLFNEFKQDYSNQFENLTTQIMQDPSQVTRIADELVKLNSKYKNDPRYKSLQDDFEKSQLYKTKLVGSDKPSYMNNPSQLKIVDGEVQYSTPEDYGIITDKDLYSTMFDDVSKFKPDIGTDEQGNKIFSMSNGDGTFTTARTESELTTLKLSRIQKYLDSMYKTSNDNGSMEYVYRHAAEQLGDPGKAKDPVFRKQVFDEYSKPILQQAYEQAETRKTIDDGNNSSRNNARGGSGPVNPVDKTDPITFNPVTTQARMANYNVAGTDRPITNMSDFDESYANIKRNRGNHAIAFKNIYRNLTGKDLVVDPQAFGNLMYNQFELNADGKITPKNKFNTNENRVLASSELFEDAWLNLRDLNATEQNIKSFENRLKEANDVDNYDKKIIMDAEKKASFKALTDVPGTDFLQRKDVVTDGDYSLEKAYKKAKELVKQNPSDGLAADFVFKYENGTIDKEKYKSNYQKAIREFLPKGSKELKIYEALDSYNNRMEDVELRMLPPSDKYVQNMAKTMLANFSTDMASKFKDLVTNEEINGADMLKKIPYKQGENNKGEMDLDKVQFGYFVDPNEGMKGVMLIQGQGKFEYPIDEGGLEQVIMTLSPEEKTRFNFYNQAIQSSQKNYGKGRINLGDDKNPYIFNFEETPSELDPKKKSYVYTDEANITRRAKSIQEMQNNISRVYENAQAFLNNPQINKDIKAIQQQILSGNISEENGNALINNYMQGVRKAASDSFGNLGKPQPQVQSKTLGW